MLRIEVRALSMLQRKNATRNNVPDSQHGREITGYLAHTSIQDDIAIIIDTLYGQEAYICRQNDSGL